MAISTIRMSLIQIFSKSLNEAVGTEDFEAVMSDIRTVEEYCECIDPELPVFDGDTHIKGEN